MDSALYRVVTYSFTRLPCRGYPLHWAAERRIYKVMKNSADFLPTALPELYSELAFASWETIVHRTMMMMSGTCSVDEYHRMVSEKSEALQHSTIALMTGGSEQAVLAPFHAKACANAERLRAKT